MDWYKIRYLTDWKKIGLITLLTVFVLGVTTIIALIIISNTSVEEPQEIILTPTCEDLPRIIRTCETFYCEEHESSFSVSFNPPHCTINKTTLSSQTICEVLVRERQTLSQIPISDFESSSLCKTTRESLLG